MIYLYDLHIKHYSKQLEIKKFLFFFSIFILIFIEANIAKNHEVLIKKCRKKIIIYNILKNSLPGGFPYKGSP